MKNLITYFSKKGLSLENGPALDRKRTGNGPARLLCVLTMFLMLFTISIERAYGTEEVAYTLDGTTTGGTNAYASESEISQSPIDWIVLGNTDQSPWRIGGGKNTAATNENRYIYSKTAISQNITKVVVTHGAKSGMTVNSVTLNVYSTAAKAVTGGDGDISSVSVTYVDNGSMTFNRPNNHNWSGRYYRIDYDLTWTSSKSAKYILFSSAVFKYESGPSCATAPTVGAPSNSSFLLTTKICTEKNENCENLHWQKWQKWQKNLHETFETLRLSPAILIRITFALRTSVYYAWSLLGPFLIQSAVKYNISTRPSRDHLPRTFQYRTFKDFFFLVIYIMSKINYPKF